MSALDIATFRADRNAALASLDETKIRAFAEKYGELLPSNPEVFWRGVHKAITVCADLPLDLRQRSKAWLDERGSSSWDDGDVAPAPRRST